MILVGLTFRPNVLVYKGILQSRDFVASTNLCSFYFLVVNLHSCFPSKLDAIQCKFLRASGP